MKKLNLKQPKYIFPLVIFLPLTFGVYEVTAMFDGKSDKKTAVATDSLNMTIPDANVKEMDGKMAAMNGRLAGDAYTAVDGIGEDKEKKDSINNGYSESDLDRIDRDNADRIRQQQAQEEMERALREQRKHINNYAGAYSSGASSARRSSSRRDELDDYAKELEYIQNRSLAAQKAISEGPGGSNSYDRNGNGYANGYGDNPYGGYGNGNGSNGYDNGNGGGTRNGRGGGSSATAQKTEVVKKVEGKNAEKFNTVSSTSDADAPLIKAMIDKTTKAHEGTRLRFKLLDDVKVKNVLLKKGTYLYGLVSGFGQQRVRATITNILVGNKFIKVNLTVYDNDGMEGFYVPESAFRDMMKQAGAQAMQQNMQLNNGYSSSYLTGESVALQALQNIYQSASSAVAGNIRKNKARIKYNTIVYLVNTEAEGNR